MLRFVWSGLFDDGLVILFVVLIKDNVGLVCKLDCYKWFGK